MSAGAYAELEGRFRRIAHLEGAAAVLHWDSATMMPSGGAAARAAQLATLGRLSHEMLAEPGLGDLIGAAEARVGALDGWQARNLELMKRRWSRARAVAPKLVEALSHACSACEARWRDARGDNDYAALAPLLSEVVRLTRERAAALADALGLEPYDALLDGYDPGTRAAAVDRLFAALRAFLPALTEATLARQAAPPAPLVGPFPIDAQRRLAEQLMVHLGLEAEHSRLDVSHHPFSGGVPDDVRITTRYSEDDATAALMGVLHETGHALYERGLPRAWRHQPVGGAHGMSLHESQSLLIEMQVSRGRPFLAFLAPRLREWLGGSGSAWEVDNLHRLYARVARGLIRVDADELTYPAHVMVRYDLERRLLGGALDPADLPEAWAVAMREHLDIVPSDDRDGCMQDIHWYAGEFGYFPTYTMGAIAAAQLFAAATAQAPDISAGIARGEFGPLVAWLRDNVHRLGSRFERDELLRRATGRPLEVTAFEKHLRTRYLDNVSD